MSAQTTVPKGVVENVNTLLGSACMQFGESLKDCNAIASETDKIFTGSDSKRGRKLKSEARQIISDLNRSQKRMKSAIKSIN